MNSYVIVCHHHHPSSGEWLIVECGIYERTHDKPRPQQQDNEKLRRNPTPPPSLGGYEPLVYEEEDEGERERGGGAEGSSPNSECTSISQLGPTLHLLDLYLLCQEKRRKEKRDQRKS